MKGRSRCLLIGATAAALILAGNLSGRTLATRDSGPLRLTIEPPLTCVATAEDDWIPRLAGADETNEAQYACGRSYVASYVALWRSQREGHEAVNEDSEIVPAAWRFWTETDRADASIGFPVTESIVRLDGEVWVIWSWYAVGDRTAPNEFWAKFAEVLNSARFASTSTARLVVAARSQDLADARAQLSAYAADVWRSFVDSRSVE